MSKEKLGDRMKSYYESISKTKLMRRCPVCIRLDGQAFHTFTKNFKKPFDDLLSICMQQTMKYLCKNIQGCVLGYTQSDEISLILIDYQTLETSAWFDYEVQKLCSVAAGMAAMEFNRTFTKEVEKWCNSYSATWYSSPEKDKIEKAYKKAVAKSAIFDARCFNIPKEEVTNLIYWRQLDAMKNSVQSLARVFYSDSELYKKDTREMIDMCLEKGCNWNDFPKQFTRGSCCIKNRPAHADTPEILMTDTVPEGKWFIDNNIPIFICEDRDYIERLIDI